MLFVKIRPVWCHKGHWCVNEDLATFFARIVHTTAWDRLTHAPCWAPSGSVLNLAGHCRQRAISAPIWSFTGCCCCFQQLMVQSCFGKSALSTYLGFTEGLRWWEHACHYFILLFVLVFFGAGERFCRTQECSIFPCFFYCAIQSVRPLKFLSEPTTQALAISKIWILSFGQQQPPRTDWKRLKINLKIDAFTIQLNNFGIVTWIT